MIFSLHVVGAVIQRIIIYVIMHKEIGNIRSLSIYGHMSLCNRDLELIISTSDSSHSFRPVIPVMNVPILYMLFISLIHQSGMDKISSILAIDGFPQSLTRLRTICGGG